MKFLKNIIKDEELIYVKKYNDVSPEPLFFCEDKKNFLKRFISRKNFTFLRFGEKNTKKRKKIVILTFIPVAIIAVLTGGVCVSVKKSETINQTLMAPKSEVVKMQESNKDTEKFLILNNSLKSNRGFNLELETFNNIKCDKNIIPNLKKLISDAKVAGYSLVVTKGYIEPAVREKEYNDEVLRLRNEKSCTLANAEAQALKTISPYYEYETGLSVTITTENLSPSEFLDTDEYNWLIRNCVEYGFVIRTPQGKENKTGLPFDTTLYRYVGINNAKKMRALNMCVEEYRKYLKLKN